MMEVRDSDARLKANTDKITAKDKVRRKLMAERTEGMHGGD